MVIYLKNISIWEDIDKFKYPTLNKDLDVDILIVGGGITGISILHHLKDTYFKIALVEQNEIGRSTTGKSTGKLTYLQNDLIDKIRFSFKNKKTLLYLKSQQETINSIVNTIKDEHINCNLKKVDSYLFTNNNNQINKIKNLELFLNNNGYRTINSNLDLVKYKYQLKVTDTYIFNPIKFIYGLVKDKDYPIYEHTSIIKIKKSNDYYICKTNNNKIIKTKWVILACHYPYFIIPYFFPIKCSLEKSYLIASKGNYHQSSIISYSKPFISIRSDNKSLIYLSNSHKVGNKLCEKKNFNSLLKHTTIKPDYIWSNIDIITNDGLPYIGEIKSKMIIATGYNTWGLTNGFLAGKIIKDIILNNKNDYIKLFNPLRINFKQIIMALVNIIHMIFSFLKSLLYRSNRIHFCPHFGCKLVFNEVEKTWDCPCHGSRFNNEGYPISAPANKKIKQE